MQKILDEAQVVVNRETYNSSDYTCSDLHNHATFLWQKNQNLKKAIKMLNEFAFDNVKNEEKLTKRIGKYRYQILQNNTEIKKVALDVYKILIDLMES